MHLLRRHAANGKIQVQYHGCSTGLRINAVPITQSNPRFHFRMKKIETTSTATTMMTL